MSMTKRYRYGSPWRYEEVQGVLFSFWDWSQEHFHSPIADFVADIYERTGRSAGAITNLLVNSSTSAAISQGLARYPHGPVAVNGFGEILVGGIYWTWLLRGRAIRIKLGTQWAKKNDSPDWPLEKRVQKHLRLSGWDSRALRLDDVVVVRLSGPFVPDVSRG